LNGPSMDLNEIMDHLNNEAFLNHIGIQKNKKGRWYVDCPFCDGKEKLSINIQKGLWKCFKCEESGNLITLYAKLNSCDNRQAVKAIKEFAGIIDEPKSKSKVSYKPKNVTPLKVKDIQTNPNQSDGDDIPPPADADAPLETKHVDSAQAAQPRDIYTALVKLAHLTEAHRIELRTKRGFTNDTIERLSFRSGGEYMTGIVETLRETFADVDLKDAGIIVEINGCLACNPQLIEDRVLIPYLDSSGVVYHLRPHKLGFKGMPIQPYCLFFLKDNPEEIVLTEGEFKAAALWQLGILAIAIPGISSFGDKHFDRLIETLREHGVKKVTVIFDNEIKDDPAFANYKEKPADRWDTDYWTYMMAYKLSHGQARFITRCGRLPDEWRQNGKIDFDGALALGKTKDEMLRVVAKAGMPKEYLDLLPDDGRLIVLKKVDKQFTKISIKREFNKYIAIRGTGDKVTEETISNFVINIKTSYFTPEGIIRSVEFVNKFGETSATFILSPGEMAGITEVKKFCLGKGNYIFRGNGSDLSNVWELEFSRNVGNVVYMPETIGYIQDHDIWLFGNMAIKAGKVYEPDSDGIMWIKGKGFKPQSIKQNQYGQESEESIPVLSTRPIDLLDVAKKIRQTVGGYEAYVGLGWAIATIFSKDIFEQYKCTPILFPHGKRESGKSTFARWIMSCFGVDIDGYGIAESTQNFIMKTLAYYSALGCWFDEYRNEYKVIQKDGFFRSAYNRQSSGKGTITATRSYSVNASLLISGEELPKDNGLFTRLLPLQLSSYKRDRTHFNWLQKNCNKFSYLAYYLITNYDALKPKIMEAIAELKAELLKTDISDRTAENWAIVAGAFYVVIDQDMDFIKWVGETCQELKQTGENEHMLNQFLEDILSMVSDHELTTEHIYQEKVDGVLYYNIWFNDIYARWAQRYRSRTGREPFDESSIRKYLSDEPYFVKVAGKIKFSDIYKRGVRILASKAPEAIAEAWQIMQSRIENASYTNYHPDKRSNDA
jgi:hypothetical protein